MNTRLYKPLVTGVALAGVLGLALGAHLGEGAATSTQPARQDLRVAALSNRAAYIPPQCYTKTQAEDGAVANPCYTCHVESRSPNFIDDAELQLGYGFPAYAQKNRWTNLWADHSEATADVTDAALDAHVRRSNYFAPSGRVALAEALARPPAEWDADGDGRWSGYVPDAAFRFDDAGFDRAADGVPTGWRAYAYRPTPGAFWPTNGSTSDVLVRLAPELRQGDDGRWDEEVYRVNLAIVEALIKREDVPLEPVDEARLQVDLDRDGQLGTATRVAYRWAPLRGQDMSYVGRARRAQAEGRLHLAAGLFPEGTELLHTVRYLDVRADGQVGLAPRLKELRYAKKTRWRTFSELEAAAAKETKEKSDFPDRLRDLAGAWSVERGINTGKGWVYQGFIEDAQGDLRPQSFEEHVFCTGCHGGVGVTDDTVFSFGRKLSADGPRGGWYHWSQQGLDGVPDRLRGDGEGEYAFYLKTNRAGDELRANDEVRARFLTPQGDLQPEAAARLAADVSTVLFPSPERARRLNRAYLGIVRTQSFAAGRDALLAPAENVHRQVEEDEDTGIDAMVPAAWRRPAAAQLATPASASPRR
ncbi:MAG: hypothetical protein KC933_24345 [Myxococcales bacterium]|nr:hypothetical protein [Myxococcales bacterium]